MRSVLRGLLVGCLAAATLLPAAAQEADLLVLIDGDMPATAYADGKLHPITGARDLLVTLPADELATPSGAKLRGVEVSNTVMGWPGSLALSPDGRHAYVVTSRGGVDRSVEALDSVYTDMPESDQLTVIDLDRRRAESFSVCPRPMSVDVAPSGDWLLVACGAGEGLAIVPLSEGRPGASPRLLDLDATAGTIREPKVGYAAIHPGGQAAGLVLGVTRIALVRFSLDQDGVPEAAELEAETPTDRWLSVARWVPSGDHLIVADVAWGPKPTDAAFNGKGALVSYALSPSGAARGEASVATVSRSPEGFALSPEGDLAVAVNMERTYLPGGWMRLFRGRDASSLSLVAVAPDGTLRTLGEPLRFEGVLPEDAAFLPGGEVAVAVYQDHDAPRSAGWVEIFALTGKGDERALAPTGRRIALPRGPHDLAVLPPRR